MITAIESVRGFTGEGGVATVGRRDALFGWGASWRTNRLRRSESVGLRWCSGGTVRLIVECCDVALTCVNAG